MASPVHVSILSSWQAMLISTLVFSFAPKLIWSHSAALPSLSKTPYNDKNYLKVFISGPRNDFSYSSPSGTATQRCCYDTGRARFPDTTLKTLSSTSACRRFTVNTSPTIKSLTFLETGWSSEASESIPTPFGQHSPTPSTEPRDKTSPSPGMKIGAGVGIGLGILILILIALAFAILWFRRRQNHHQRKPTMNGLEREPNPSFEGDSAKSPRVRSDGISSQDHSWLADGRNISRETHKLPLCGPGLTVLSPEENPLVIFPNVPPSSEGIFPPNTRQAHSSVDLDPPPPLAAKKSHGFVLPISQQESKDASSPSASSLIILDSPQSITPEVRSGGVRAHLRDHPQPLRSNSSASRGTLADPPNHRETNIANNSPGSNSTAVGPTTTVKDSLDAINDSAATIQNFSRKIGSHRSRQGRDSGGGWPSP